MLINDATDDTAFVLTGRVQPGHADRFCQRRAQWRPFQQPAQPSSVQPSAVERSAVERSAVECSSVQCQPAAAVTG